jgi:hypothetical protein
MKVIAVVLLVAMVSFGVVIAFLALRALVRHTRDAGLKVQPLLGPRRDVSADESRRPTRDE